MIAAYVLAFVPLVWPVPLSARPFERPPLQIGMQMTRPRAGNGEDQYWTGEWYVVRGSVTSTVDDPLSAVMVQTFTDSCGTQRVWVEALDLAPFEWENTDSWVHVHYTSCLGWGYVERYITVDGAIPEMPPIYCKLLSKPTGCRARIGVPVWVNP